jgi:25S rRNA (uracil2634-N3)-methyltransferase
MLLVGEGNFSFALSLAKLRAANSPHPLFPALLQFTHVTATSLDTEAEVVQRYAHCDSYLAQLRTMSVALQFQVNAIKLTDTYDPLKDRFDCIVFNFPHTGTPTTTANSVSLSHFSPSFSAALTLPSQVTAEWM